MAETKKKKSDVLNPLQHFFGCFLRLERLKLGRTSADVANTLDLTDSYLRLAESGRATLNQSLAFKIIEVYVDPSAQTRENRTISFNRLAVFLVASHWLAAEMTVHEPDHAARRAFEALAARVSDFEIFLERTKKYFDLEEGSAEQKKFLEDVAAPEVRAFLRSDTYGAATPGELSEGLLGLKELLDLPSLNIEPLLDLKESLAGRPFVHTADIAARWEARASSKFRRVSGVYATSELIISEPNLEQFDYRYLANPRFESVRMIFVAGGNEKKLLTEFIKFLNAGRSKKREVPELRPEERDKIHIRCLSGPERLKFESQVNALRLRPGTADVNDAYWSFKTHDGLDFGFVGVRGMDAENTRNLRIRDSLQRARQFNDLWTDLDAAR
jgi:hypothetical protein